MKGMILIRTFGSGQTGDSLEIAELHRRNYSPSGVFTSWAMAGPNLVKSRTFHAAKYLLPLSGRNEQ